MPRKNLVLIINAPHTFIKNTESDEDLFALGELLFPSISSTYIPLLNMMEALEDEEIPFKLSLVLSAPLCSMLDDPRVQKKYIDWLDRCIALGEQEIERTKGDEELNRNAQECLTKAKKDRMDFIDGYNQDLVSAFRELAKKGRLEIIPTAATYAFLPHYSDLTEALNAQVETGLYAHRHFFGEMGEGFFIPYLGWSKSLKRVLRSYGINYTIVDARSILFAKESAKDGIFSPVRCNNSLVLFGKDPDTPADISGENGFCRNAVYRSPVRDIGYELTLEQLAAFAPHTRSRAMTGYKYWSNRNGRPYDSKAASEQARADAVTFYESKAQKLNQALPLMEGRDATLVCVLGADLLGNTWHEGITWLDTLIRTIAANKDIELEHCRSLIEDQFSLPKMEPYECADNGSGYGEDLLDRTNKWMQRYLRKATERMIDLTERFPSETGLKARLLNLGAKEVLLAQSGMWPLMMHDERMPDFVEKMFQNQILAFTKVFDSLASNTVSTEWLTTIEKEDCIFPWINYRIFSRKK